MNRLCKPSVAVSSVQQKQLHHNTGALNQLFIMRMKLWCVCCLLVALMLPVMTWANNYGSGGCHKTKQLGPEGYKKAAQLTHKLKTYLTQQDADVVILGRKGSRAPEKRFRRRVGLWNYTHAGFAYRNPSLSPKSKPESQAQQDSVTKRAASDTWTVIHMLNICNDESGIFKETLMQFSLSDLREYKTAIGIPTQAMQRTLYPMLQNKQLMKAMRNNSVYSSISNPYNTTFQNSNEYLLDIIVAGIARLNGKNISSREQSKAYFHGAKLTQQFEPEEVRVRFHERLGSNFGLGPGNASIRDHGLIERSDGKVDMVSVGALIQFLEKTGYLSHHAEVKLKDSKKASDTQVVTVP